MPYRIVDLRFFAFCRSYGVDYDGNLARLLLFTFFIIFISFTNVLTDGKKWTWMSRLFERESNRYVEGFLFALMENLQVFFCTIRSVISLFCTKFEQLFDIQVNFLTERDIYCGRLLQAPQFSR